MILVKLQDASPIKPLWSFVPLSGLSPFAPHSLLYQQTPCPVSGRLPLLLCFLPAYWNSFNLLRPLVLRTLPIFPITLPCSQILQLDWRLNLQTGRNEMLAAGNDSPTLMAFWRSLVIRVPQRRRGGKKFSWGNCTRAEVLYALNCSPTGFYSLEP